MAWDETRQCFGLIFAFVEWVDRGGELGCFSFWVVGFMVCHLVALGV